MLYLPLDTPPRAVFPVHTRGSALTHIYGCISAITVCGICVALNNTVKLLLIHFHDLISSSVMVAFVLTLKGPCDALKSYSIIVNNLCNHAHSVHTHIRV